MTSHSGVIAKRAIAAITLFICFSGLSFAKSESPPTTSEKFPFREGELFIYDISWSKFLYAGVGTLGVVRKGKVWGHESYLFQIEGRTIGFINKIHPVLDRTTAWFDIKNRRTLFSDINISENQYKKHKTITFNHDKNEVDYKINDRPGKVYKIEPGAVGPISALYVFRYMPKKLISGEVIKIPLFDSGKMYNLSITIIDKERIRLPIGEVNTIKTVADLKSEGVFRRKGKMTIWFSDDKTFAPVQISTKLPIGSMFATLREYKGATIDALTLDKDNTSQEKQKQ